MLKQELEQLGLSDKEARVYLAALELGSAPVQKISHKAKVNRATTYVIIDSLIEMGLMSSFEEGKKTIFVAEQPERLLDILKDQRSNLEKKIQHLQERMPEFKSIFNAIADKPKVKYYEGVEGLKSVQRDFQESIENEGMIFTFLPYDEFQHSTLLTQLNEVRRSRVEKGIKYRIIYTSKTGRKVEYERRGRELLQEFYYVENERYPFRGGMNIYGKKVFLIDYLGRMSGVVIENGTIAQLMKCLFLLIWDSQKK